MYEKRFCRKTQDESENVLPCGEDCDTIGSGQRFMSHSKADPMADVMGPAEESYPEEVKKMEARLKELGVELICKDRESLGYSPRLKKGYPGQVSI